MAMESEEEEAVLLNTTKVVEYLAPLMSVELLCKFPDNSAYDFDYSQSTIWSPLVPRPYTPMLITPMKLSYDYMALGARSSGNKLKKKKFSSTPFNLKLDFTKKKHHNKSMKKLPSDFSPKFKGACNPILNKVFLFVVFIYLLIYFIFCIV